MYRLFIAAISVFLCAQFSLAQSGHRQFKSVDEIFTQLMRMAEFARRGRIADQHHQVQRGIELVMEGMKQRVEYEKKMNYTGVSTAVKVCQALDKLADYNLVLFDAQLRDLENTFLNGCRAHLLTKLEQKYQRDREELRRLYPRKKKASLETQSMQKAAADLRDSGVMLAANDACAGKIGNTQPIYVEYMKGPQYGSYDTTPNYSPHIRKLPGLQPKEVVITLDDGPAGARTEKTIQAFAEHCVRATYFLIGRMIRAPGGAQTLQKILDAGHNVASHTDTHRLFNAPNMTYNDRVFEIENNIKTFNEAFKVLRMANAQNANKYVLTPFFRFPGGNETPDALQYLVTANTASMTWEAGANDWLPNMTAASQLQVALQQIEWAKGGIFLAHDTHQATADMMPYLLDELEARGYTVRFMVPRGW